MRVHAVVQLSDPRKNIGVLGVNFYCGRGDSPYAFPVVMAKWHRLGAAAAVRSLRRRAHPGRLPTPLRRRRAHHLRPRRVAATVRPTRARAAGQLRGDLAKALEAAPSPLLSSEVTTIATNAAAHSPVVLARPPACSCASLGHVLRCHAAMSGAAARGTGWHQSRVPVHDVGRLVRPIEADPIFLSCNEPCLRMSGPGGIKLPTRLRPPPHCWTHLSLVLTV